MDKKYTEEKNMEKVRSLLQLMMILLFSGSLFFTVLWHMLDNNSSTINLTVPVPLRKRAPKTYELCKGCKEFIEGIMQRYSQTWERQEDNFTKFRSQLKSSCNGFDNAILSQANAPVGLNISYESQRKISPVSPELFRLLPKEHPFLNKTLDTCAVIGNGGILAESGCGETIDSAQFVIRCNLPPLENGYERDVGVKTDLVTTNPTILNKRYGGLMKSRRLLKEDLRMYGSAMVMFVPFSFAAYTAVSMRAVYTITDFDGPTRPVLLNPEYHRSLAAFWRKRGLQEKRLTTGIMMVSLALELCDNVHLFGFWPFDNHPHGLHNLKHHYYDNMLPKRGFHSMPAEFELLLRLHSEGVLKLHLEDCKPGKH